MSEKKKQWIQALSGAVLLPWAGFFFYESPSQSPELGLAKSGIFGVLLLFVYFSWSVAAWGFFAARSCHLQKNLLPAVLPLGLAIGFFFLSLLSFFGGLQSYGRNLSIVFLSAGIILASLRKRPTIIGKIILGFAQKTLLYRLTILFLILQILLTWLLASKLHPFWDPLWYHLVGPERWYEMGKIAFTPDHIIAYNTGAWDQLYLFAFLLLGAPGGGGLVACQIFAQWMHACLAMPGALVGLAYFARIFTRDRNLQSLILLGVSGIPMAFFTTMLAKNDWGAMLWLFSGLAILFGRYRLELLPQELFLACLFLGLAVTSKWTIIFIIFPFCIWWKLRFFCKPMSLAKRCKISLGGWVGFLGGALPICWRNYSATHDPFFPAMQKIFPTAAIGPTWARTISENEGMAVFQEYFPAKVWDSFREISSQNILYLTFLCLPLLFLWRKDLRRFLKLWLAVLIAISFYIMFSGKTALPRWLVPAVILIGVTCMVTLVVFLRDIPKYCKVHDSVRDHWSQMIYGGFLAILLLESPLPLLLHSSASAGDFFDYATELQQHVEMPAISWVRAHTTPRDKVLFLAETRVYYLSDRRYTRLWDDARLDRAITLARDTQERVGILVAEGFRYMVDTYEIIDRFQNFTIMEDLRNSYLKYPATIVFQTDKARVIDVQAWGKAQR